LFAKKGKKMNILHFGLNSELFPDAVYYPLIRTIPLYPKFEKRDFSYIIVTSKETLKYLPEIREIKGIFIAIGDQTLKSLNISALKPKIPTQEGILALLDELRLSCKDSVFYPRSALARPFLAGQICNRGAELVALDVYTTQRVLEAKLPPLEPFDQIIFSSPSVVEAFFALKPKELNSKKFYCIGPITQKKMDEQLAIWYNGGLKI
jgi:uroporphyrinogen-III synthase